MEKLILNEGYSNFGKYIENGIGSRVKIKNNYYLDLSNCAEVSS